MQAYMQVQTGCFAVITIVKRLYWHIKRQLSDSREGTEMIELCMAAIMHLVANRE